MSFCLFLHRGRLASGQPTCSVACAWGSAEALASQGALASRELRPGWVKHRLGLREWGSRKPSALCAATRFVSCRWFASSGSRQERVFSLCLGPMFAAGAGLGAQRASRSLRSCGQGGRRRSTYYDIGRDPVWRSGRRKVSNVRSRFELVSFIESLNLSGLLASAPDRRWLKSFGHSCRVLDRLLRFSVVAGSWRLCQPKARARGSKRTRSKPRAAT